MSKAYKLAREYAAEEYTPKDPEFWICVSAFLSGYEAANTPDGTIPEVIITGMIFRFASRIVKVSLYNDLKIANKKEFIKQMTKITNCKTLKLNEK